MRNLKRALSLVLAVVMVIGLMVVGAGAVSYNDFSDREEIVNKDAVSMLTTLGIIEGQPDGSYNPTGDVDRAQMAKMISVALTNNEDCDTLYQNVNSGLTDITANWARGYINYCYVRGIIAGRGDNTFDPSANVTGVEAAKMLLAALGYNAEIEGLVGPDWALNTAALAQQLGIFRNFTKDVSEPLNRDDAALLIYNALDVEMIQQYSNGYALVYSDHRTILSSVFGVMRVEGVVVGNEWAQLEKTNSDAALREGKTNLDNVVVYDSTTSNTTVPEGIKYDDIVPFNVSTPVEYIGKAVTMYVEKTTILANAKVIGVATNDEMNVINTTVSSEDTSKDYLKGTGVTVNEDTEYYVNYGITGNESDAINTINDMAGIANKKDYKFNLNGIEVEIIDNNNDGTAEYVLYTVETLSEVRSYSARNEEVAFYTPGKDRSVTVDMADVVTELDFTTGDLILYVQYGGRTYVTEPEIITGTMTRVDRDKDDELYITVNDEEYYQSYIPDVASDVDADLTHFDITRANTEPGFSNEYDFILDSNGYVVAIRPAEEIVTNYALVLDSAWTLNGLRRGGTIEVLMADGTKGTYDIDWSKSVKNVFGKDNDDDMEDYLGTRDVVGGEGTGAAVGTVITYSLSDDEVLTIESVLKTHETLGSDGYVQKDKVDNGDIAYIEENTAAEDNKVVGTTPNLQWTLEKNYDNGDASIILSDGTNDAVKYAVDRNTVAFYYYVDPKTDEISYGVATGWNNMGDVLADNPDKAGTNDVGVQVYPVMEKDRDNDGWKPTKLADVLLINAANNPTSSDYMLVLNRNARVADDTLLLNVVFEDGTTKEIEIDDNNSDADFDREGDFMAAYPYVENADGTYDITDEPVYTSKVSSLLEVGTVDANGDYYALPDDAKVWDVNDVDSASDEPQAGEFYFIDVNAVIIPTTQPNGRTIRTAWIWDYDVDNDDDNFDVSDYLVKLDDDKNEVVIYFNHELCDPGKIPSLDRSLNLIESKLKDKGYTIIERTRDGIKYTWKVEDSHGFSDTFNFTYDDVKSLDDDWIIPSYVGKLNGDEIFVPTDSADLSTVLDGTHFYGRLTENESRTYQPVAAATVTGNGFDIEDGYTAVDLSGISFAGETGVEDLKITSVTVNGDKEDFGSTGDVVYVSGDDNEIVATVTGSVKVAANTEGQIGGTNDYAIIVAIDDDGKNDGDGNQKEISVSGHKALLDNTSGTGVATYDDFTLTFTWTVDAGNSVVNLVLNTKDLKA